jgi:hypothetical protein
MCFYDCSHFSVTVLANIPIFTGKITVLSFTLVSHDVMLHQRQRYGVVKTSFFLSIQLMYRFLAKTSLQAAAVRSSVTPSRIVPLAARSFTTGSGDSKVVS